MTIKKTLIAASLATALGLIAGAPLAMASDRDDSPNAHQSELDAQYARGQSGATAKSGTTAYGYVPAPAHHTTRK